MSKNNHSDFWTSVRELAAMRKNIPEERRAMSGVRRAMAGDVLHKNRKFMNNELYEHLRSYVVHMVKARPWRLCELQAHADWDELRAVEPKHVARVCDDLVAEDVIRLRSDGFFEAWF